MNDAIAIALGIDRSKCTLLVPEGAEAYYGGNEWGNYKAILPSAPIAVTCSPGGSFSYMGIPVLPGSHPAYTLPVNSPITLQLMPQEGFVGKVTLNGVEQPLNNNSCTLTLKREDLLKVDFSGGQAPQRAEAGGLRYEVTAADAVKVIDPAHGSYTGALHLPDEVTAEGQHWKVTAIGLDIDDTQKAGNQTVTSLTVGNGVTEIPAYLFAKNSNFNAVTFGDNVDVIGMGAFAQTALPAVDLKNVKNIGARAFADTPLTTVDLSKVTTLGAGAFEHTQLAAVNLQNVKFIEPRTFKDTPLTEVDLHHAQEIGAQAFQNTRLTTLDCKEVKFIYENAFQNTLLTEVDLKKVKGIGAQAFQNTRLTTLDLKDVQTIGDGAFENTPLTQVDFKRVNEIGKRAFANTAFTEIKTNNILASECFADCKQLKTADINYSLGLPEGIFRNSPVQVLKVRSNSLTDKGSGLDHARLTLLVDETYVDRYRQTAPWSGCKEILPAAPLSITCSEGGGFSCKGMTFQPGTYPDCFFPVSTPVTLTLAPHPGYASSQVLVNGQAQPVSGSICTLTLHANDRLEVKFKQGTLEQLDINDATDSYHPEYAKAHQLTYTRHYQAGRWVPLYLPFGLQYADWKDHFDVAYLNDVHQHDLNDDGVIDETHDRTALEIIRMNEQSAVLPNVPYMIRAKETGDFTFRLNDVTLPPALENTLDCSSLETLYTFTGNYTRGRKVAGSYVMADGALNLASDKVALGAFRWYLTVTDRLSGAPVQVAKRILLIEKDEAGNTTGIEELSAPETFDLYDLNGRLIRKAARSTEGIRPGIYIVNGKKVIL